MTHKTIAERLAELPPVKTAFHHPSVDGLSARLSLCKQVMREYLEAVDAFKKTPNLVNSSACIKATANLRLVAKEIAP